MSVNIEVKLA